MNPLPQTVMDHFGVAVAAITGVLAAVFRPKEAPHNSDRDGES